MDFDRAFSGVFFILMVLVTAFVFGLGVLLFSNIQEHNLMLDCLNNGGHWLTNYAIGCTYPMG